MTLGARPALGAGARGRGLAPPACVCSRAIVSACNGMLGLKNISAIIRSRRSTRAPRHFCPIPHALYGMTHLASLCRLLAEREPHPHIHSALCDLLDILPEPDAPEQAWCCSSCSSRRARFRARSYKLRRDWRAGGSRVCLAEIGPRSIAPGRRAVEAQAAGVAVFLRGHPRTSHPFDDIAAGFALTGFFLARHVRSRARMRFADARASFIAAIARSEARD